MKGYILNGASMWMHAMKRSVAPGGRIPIDELYDQYGPKHGLEKGQEFIEWLKNVKLKGNSNWKVIVEDVAAVVDKSPETVVEEKIEVKKVDNSKFAHRNMEIADIVEMSVRKAKDVLPHIIDVNLLKYSLSEASPRPGKESLCRLLRKRIMELETQRR